MRASPPDILAGDVVPMSSVPLRPSLHVLSVFTEEPAPVPALDCDTIRLYRTQSYLAVDTFIHLAGDPMWAHVYAMPVGGGSLVLMSVGPSMLLTYQLAATPAGGAGDRLLQEYAPRARALVTTGRTTVDGADVGIVNLPVGDDRYISVLVTFEGGPIGDRFDADLFQRLTAPLPVAVRLSEETFDLAGAVQALSPHDRQQLLAARSTVDWRRVLERSAQIVDQLAEVAGVAEKITGLLKR